MIISGIMCFKNICGHFTKDYSISSLFFFWATLYINYVMYVVLFYLLYAIFRTVYQKLGSVVSEDQRQLYTQRVEEITPNLRYCAYNIGGVPTDVTELMKLRSNAPGSDILASKIDVCLKISCYMYFSTFHGLYSTVTCIRSHGKKREVGVCNSYMNC